MATLGRLTTLTAPPLVFAKSHDHLWWEKGDSSRADDVDALYSDEASSAHSPAGRRSSEEDPYDGSKPYEDRSPYSLSDVLGSNATPPGLDTSALLPVLFALL